MPPRFDRDNSMHPLSVQMMPNNGGLCAAGSNGPNGNGNNQMLLGNNMGSNGGIGTVSASLRKPLLEINGLLNFKNVYLVQLKFRISKINIVTFLCVFF